MQHVENTSVRPRTDKQQRGKRTTRQLLTCVGVCAVGAAVSLGAINAVPASAKGSKHTAVIKASVLKRGNKGSAVKALQRRLRITAVSGRFGKGTERYVRKFQTRHRLKPDGIAGPKTLALLGLKSKQALVAEKRAEHRTRAAYHRKRAAQSKRHAVRHKRQNHAKRAYAFMRRAKFHLQQARIHERRGGHTHRASSHPAVPGQLKAVLHRIAACESGHNPRAVSRSGTYRGMFQFSHPTWRAVGGQGDPASASISKQYHRAAVLYQRAGAGQWPVCGRR